MFSRIKRFAKRFWICRVLWHTYKKIIHYPSLLFKRRLKQNKRLAPCIVQLVAGYSKNDAIGNMVLELSNKLNQMGYMNYIVYGDSYERDFNTYQVSNFNFNKNDIVIYHMSIGSRCSYIFKNIKVRRKIMIYHNITPARFFSDNKEAASNCKKGRDELNILRNTPNLSIAVSKYNEQELIEIGYNNTKVIPCIHRIDELLTLKTNVTLKKENTIFITVGRIVSNKCISDVIRVFIEYHKMNRDSLLYIIGKYDNDNYFKHIEKLIKNERMSNYIKISGMITNQELAKYYQMADAYICMSEHEGFCVPIIEAMAFGVPVFAYDSSAVSDTVSHSGILFKEKNYNFIAKKIFDTLNNTIELKNIIEAGYKRYNFFNNEKNINDYINSFNPQKVYYISPEVINLYRASFDNYKYKINDGNTMPFSYLQFCDKFIYGDKSKI